MILKLKTKYDTKIKWMEILLRIFTTVYVHPCEATVFDGTVGWGEYGTAGW